MPCWWRKYIPCKDDLPSSCVSGIIWGEWHFNLILGYLLSAKWQLGLSMGSSFLGSLVMRRSPGWNWLCYWVQMDFKELSLPNLQEMVVTLVYSRKVMALSSFHSVMLMYIKTRETDAQTWIVYNFITDTGLLDKNCPDNLPTHNFLKLQFRITVQSPHCFCFLHL